MSNPEDRGEPGHGRRHARPSSGDTGGQGGAGQGGWPSRYGPLPDFTLPPDTIGILPGDDAPAQRRGGPADVPADSGWFTSPTDSTQPSRGSQPNEAPGSQEPTRPSRPQEPGRPYEGTRRSSRGEAPPDPYTQPQPGRRRRPDAPDARRDPPGTRRPESTGPRFEPADPGRHGAPGDSAPRAPQARQSPSGPQTWQSPWAPPASRAPQTPPASPGRAAVPGFVPHHQAHQPGYDDADYDQPASYTGRRSRNPEPEDYGRDGYSGPGDPYAEHDGYANRADPYADRDGYAVRQDRPADGPRYDYDESAQHVAGPGRATSRGAAPAEPEPQWDDYEEGYEDRFVPGLGGGHRDDEYDGAGAGRGRGGRGGRSGRGGSSGGTGKRRRRWLVPLVVILVVLLIPVGVGAFYVYRTVQNRYYPADYSTAGTGQAIIQVQDGQTASQVGQRLVTLGVVASVRAFELAAEHSTSSSTLEPGFYRMKKHMKATLAYSLLLNPSSRVQDKITIPEGWRISQIETQLGAKSGIPLADYQAALASPSSLGLPAYAGNNPEGYLYPATYEVQPDQTANGVLKTMVQRFEQEASSINLTASASAARMTPAQVIIVASLLQAEGGRLSDYPKIARVIANRLAKSMPLQFDSTVLYGLHEFGTTVTEQQIKTNTPYNTYLHKGLPPTPIDSPGNAAIQAALHPASGDWLYFITGKNGVTKFSSTLSGLNG